MSEGGGARWPSTSRRALISQMPGPGRERRGRADHTCPRGGRVRVDETGDLKDGTLTAHVGRQYLGNVGKIGQGVVSVSSQWEDEQIYYPLAVMAYTPADRFPGGKKDLGFKTKLTIAIELVKQAALWQWPFKAVVADSFYGEDASVREYLHEAGIECLMALKPSHGWWQLEGQPDSLKDIAQMPR